MWPLSGSFFHVLHFSLNISSIIYLSSLFPQVHVYIICYLIKNLNIQFRDYINTTIKSVHTIHSLLLKHYLFPSACLFRKIHLDFNYSLDNPSPELIMVVNNHMCSISLLSLNLIFPPSCKNHLCAHHYIPRLQVTTPCWHLVLLNLLCLKLQMQKYP